MGNIQAQSMCDADRCGVVASAIGCILLAPVLAYGAYILAVWLVWDVWAFDEIGRIIFLLIWFILVFLVSTVSLVFVLVKLPICFNGKFEFRILQFVLAI